MSNNKTLKVFSSTAVAGMIAAAMMSSQAFAAVDAYSVKVGDQIYKYDRVQLEKSFLDSKAGDKAALYEDFTKKLGEAKGFYAFNDTKNGYVDYNSIEAKFLEAKNAGQKFDVNAFTESKDAKIVEVKAVKKAVVNKDGNVEYEEETTKGDPNAEVSIKSVEALSLKQIKVNFVKAINNDDKKDDIEDKDNYTIYNDEKNEIDQKIQKVELDQSGKFAIITMADTRSGDKFEVIKDTKNGIVNQEKYTIEFDENITGKEVKEDINFKDYSSPKVDKIEVIGEDSIKVKFTEPVRPHHFKDEVPYLDSDDIEINSGDISVNEIELTNNNTEATVKVGYTLKDNQKLKVRVKGSIEDYAGYGVISMIDDNVVVKKDKSLPTVKSFKNAKKNKVTLVFAQDIKFKDSDDKVKESGLDDFYHTNTTNKATKVELDGRELTIYFDKDAELPANGDTYINIKAGAIETLWNVQNDKIVSPVKRMVDESKLQIRSIEQDKDNGDQIIVKFSKEIDEKEAERTSNYTLKDAEGNKWSINNVKKDKDNNKKVIVTTSKNLDSGKYKLTIKDVEDTAGKAIEKVTKEFTATEKDARKSDDLSVNLYKSGTTEQKLVVDFDTEMKVEGKYSVKDLAKYTLIADNNVFGKNHDKNFVKVEDLYGVSSIKAIENNKKIQIDMPYKKNKDDSYKIEIKDGKAFVDGKEAKNLRLVVGKVADVDNNTNAVEISVPVEGAKPIKIKKESGEKLVRATATDKVEVVFNDGINFKKDDVRLFAIGEEYKGERTVEALTKAAKASDEVEEVKFSAQNERKNGRTRVTLTLDKHQEGSAYKEFDDNKDHVLGYDGKFNGKNLYVVTVADPKSDNDYDATIEGNLCEKVIDNIAPAIVDNSKRDERHRYLGNGKFGKTQNNEEAVEYYREKDSDTGRIVLTFEEPIAESSLSNNTFKLDSDKKFVSVEVESVKVNKDNPNQVVINVKGLNGIKDDGEFASGFDVKQNAPIADISEINRKQGNQVEGIKTQIGEFDNLAKYVVVVKVDKTALDESVKNANDKIKDAAKYTKESVEKVQAALKKVEAAKTQEEVNAVKAEIDAAVAGLKEVVDTADKSVVKFEITKRVASPAPGQDIVVIELKDVDASKYDVLINEQKAKFNIKNKKFGGIVNSTLKGEELNKAIKVVLKK